MEVAADGLFMIFERGGAACPACGDTVTGECVLGLGLAFGPAEVLAGVDKSALLSGFILSGSVSVFFLPRPRPRARPGVALRPRPLPSPFLVFLGHSFSSLDGNVSPVFVSWRTSF